MTFLVTKVPLDALAVVGCVASQELLAGHVEPGLDNPAFWGATLLSAFAVDIWHRSRVPHRHLCGL